MRIKGYLLIGITFALCVTLLSEIPVFAEGLSWSPDRKALAGLESFDLEQAVVCEFPDDADTKFIERWDKLKQHIKLAFGAYGIKVYSFDLKSTDEEKMRYGDADAQLYVRITDVIPLCIPDMYSYCVTIYVVDWVITTENPDTHFKAITWADSRNGIASLALLESEVYNTLDKRLDKLIKDYIQSHAERLKADSSNFGDEAHTNAEPKEQAGFNWLGVQLCSALLLISGVLILKNRRKLFPKSQ
jgi:hypothetical protein